MIFCSKSQNRVRTLRSLYSAGNCGKLSVANADLVSKLEHLSSGCIHSRTLVVFNHTHRSRLITVKGYLGAQGSGLRARQPKASPHAPEVSTPKSPPISTPAVNREC